MNSKHAAPQHCLQFQVRGLFLSLLYSFYEICTTNLRAMKKFSFHFFYELLFNYLTILPNGLIYRETNTNRTIFWKPIEAEWTSTSREKYKKDRKHWQEIWGEKRKWKNNIFAVLLLLLLVIVCILCNRSPFFQFHLVQSWYFCQSINTGTQSDWSFIVLIGDWMIK